MTEAGAAGPSGGVGPVGSASPDAAVPPGAPIGVIGGGTMGAGIAHVLADRGRRVVLVEATALA
jgi:NADPH-dependent 2,4-dienoyl-CoA reductase/sulfur reductase-like enzyme